jgi:hypothetical protein
MTSHASNQPGNAPGGPGARGARDQEQGAHDDEQLVARLRDLSLIDLDLLLGGASPEQAALLLDAHAEELADALRAARARMQALVREVAAGPDPFGLLDADARQRTRENARAAGERSALRLRARAQAGRALARLDELAARILPRLLEADRRRHGHL